MKEYLIAGILALGAATAISSCVTADEEGNSTLESIEQMSDLQYARMSQYTYLATKIGAARLLDAGGIDAETLVAVADAVEGVTKGPLLELAGGFLTEAVNSKVTLTSDELSLILLIVEQELLTRGGGTYINEAGELRLTQRASDLLVLVANALRAATGGMEPGEEGQLHVLEKSYSIQ